MADEMAPMLPMRMNQDMSIQTVFAAGNVVTMTAKYEYDRTLLERILATAGVSNEQALQFMRNHARSGPLCSVDEGRNFIAHGGVIRYLYRFNDGAIHTVIDVTACQ
ncbi:hypothetical protein ABB34_05160 [Stenotrophomonas daejeonensis]|uniref:Uncharacterized protein n=2 Tax=Stenotrophomonas daejeonensis TaxID=659018 RepID=A0A0R0E9S5_9GAMM|nr:hypothetical protein ABB34_05160 [Stenotrophomonas daejeonensis]